MNTKNQFKNFLSIIDAIPASIYWKDKSGKTLGCNKYMLEMAGMERKDIIGKTDYELVWKDAAEKLRQADEFVIKNDTIYETEETGLLANGQKHTYLSTKAPLYDEATEEIIGIIGVSVDITDRKKAEQLQKQKDKEVFDQISQAVETLSGSIAHEIRTPLSIIGINIDRLQLEFDKTLTSSDKTEQVNKIKELINNIKFAIKSASNIINMLLVKLRNIFHTNNASDTKLKPYSIKSCINEAIQEYPFYNDEYKAIVWDDAANKDFIYEGNYLLTKHVLFNLIKNALRAIKETERGKIYISLRTDKNSNHLIFRDTASGIPPKMLDSIFQQFSSTSKDGAGLGLAFCKTIMNSYNGDITCNSKTGKYTEFVLSFPATNNT
ncbi:MAG: Sensor protein [uncultured bacterium]|nr:MAG: Sensor protein [uncultured bacterium]